jgi:Tol biopolymer transport system component
MLVLAITAVVGQSGNNLFQQALVKERTEGNIAAAIALYQAIVDKYSTDRPLVARALVQMGSSYEKLRHGDARKVYERVVREFADQIESAATARARLSAMQSIPVPAADGPVVRRLWDNVDQWSYPVGAPSADGRYIGFSGEGDELYVRDLKENTSRRLTTDGEKTGFEEEVGESLVSPDGRHVAYGWSVDGPGFDLRMLPVSGQPAEPRILHSSDETDYMVPVGWTPNNTGILVLRTLQDRTGQIAFVSTADGSLRVLKSPRGWAQLGKVSLSPDGRFIAYSGPAGPGLPAHDIFVLAADGSREAVVVQSPAEDRQPVWTPDGKQILFVSNRAGGSSLWTVHIAEGRPKGSPALVRTDISRLLGMTRNGALYYVTGGPVTNIYTADVDANMKVTGVPAPATDRFVNGNTDPKWSRDGQHLAYRRGATIVIRSAKTGDERLVPTELRAAQLTGWFPDGRSVLVLSLDAEQRRTNFHRLDTTNGSTELLFSIGTDLNGIGFRRRPDLSPDGKAIFYVDQSPEPNEQSLMRFDIDRRRAVELTRTRADSGGEGGQHLFKSLAVSPDGARLAYAHGEWLSVIPAAGGEPRRIFRRALDDGYAFSRWELAWSADQRYLLFASDKDDAGLERGGDRLWRVPVGGGEREATGLSSTDGAVASYLAVHPNGHRITFVKREDRSWELWALENFLPKTGAVK